MTDWYNLKDGDEDWMDIPGFPSHMISNYGNVCNWKSGIILKPRPSGWGYLQVILWRDGRAHTKSIHLMVAHAFVPGFDYGLEPNHIDGHKLNNHESNLEWVTKRGNNQHAIDMGLRTPYTKPVEIIETGQRFSSVKECAEYLETWPTVISRVLTGNRPHYKNMTFRYVC